MVKLFPGVPKFLRPLLYKHGLGILVVAKAIAQSFKIPSDVDDSSVNLSLGRLLYSIKEKFPKAYEKWNKQNYDYTNYF